MCCLFINLLDIYNYADKNSMLRNWKTFRWSIFPSPSLCLTLSGRHRRTDVHPSVLLKHCQGSSFHLHWGRGEEKTERKTEGDENSDGLKWELVCYSAARGQRVKAEEEAWKSWTVICDFPLFSQLCVCEIRSLMPSNCDNYGFCVQKAKTKTLSLFECLIHECRSSNNAVAMFLF